MIAKFNTGGIAPNTGTGKGGNTLLWIIGLGLVGFLAYKYIIKPEMDKNKAQQAVK